MFTSVGAVLGGQFDLYDAFIKPWMFSRDGLLTVALRDHQIASTTSLTGFVGASIISQDAIVGVVVDITDTRSLLMAPTSIFGKTSEFQRLMRSETGSRPEIITISGTADDSFGAAALQSLATADAANTQEVAASQLAISNSYYESVLSQARRSFAAAIVSAAIGLAFFISAVFVALSSSVFSAAVLSTISGAIVEVISGLNFWLYSKTSSQLETFHVRLERTQRFLLANSVAENLHDDHERDQAIMKLVDTISMATSEPRDQRLAGP